MKRKEPAELLKLVYWPLPQSLHVFITFRSYSPTHS